jgi:hypothetical protein
MVKMSNCNIPCLCKCFCTWLFCSSLLNMHIQICF